MKNEWYRSRSLFARPPAPKPPRRKWRVRYVLVAALKRTCMVIGALVLISSLLSVMLSGFILGEIEAPTLPREMVLLLPLEEGLAEHEDAMGAFTLTGKYQTIRKVAGALDYAAADPRVKGFVMTLEGGELNMAHLDELRDAVLRFRKAGKFAYIYAPSYETLGQYHLASAFDEIWLQPMGIVSIPGVNVEMPFIRTALDKIGVEPQVFARKEYKSLFESLTSHEMSPETREMMSSIVQDIALRTVRSAAAGREMEEARFQALVDKALFTGGEALEAGLVDRLEYNDSFNRHLKEIVTGDPENEDEIFAPMYGYVKDVADRSSFSAVGAKKPKVALIYAIGQLVLYDGGSGHLAAADSLVDYIREAADDENIGLIVLRVDSPGGSPVAAEAVRRAVVKAQEEGKQVIVSMGETAASGGYWIAADADYIFAAPSTLTGSIGVTGGKLSLEQMWGKIGVNWDRVSWGENSGLWSFNRPYTPSEAERMEAMMDDVYNSFVTLVAEGRDMSPDQVDRIAGGRVWTGAQAQELGLVDALGGLTDSLDYAATLLGRKNRHDLEVITLPQPKGLMEQVLELLQGQVLAGDFLSRHEDSLIKIEKFLSRFDTRGATVSVSAPGWTPAN